MFFSTIIGVLFFLRILKTKKKKKKKIISYESLAMPMEGHELHKKKGFICTKRQLSSLWMNIEEDL